MNARAAGGWGWDRGLLFAFGALELEASPDLTLCFADEEMNREKRNELPKLTLDGTGGLSLKQEGLPCRPSTQARCPWGFLWRWEVEVWCPPGLWGTPLQSKVPHSEG